MRQLAASTHFRKQLKQLSTRDQQQVTTALKEFLAALTAGQLPAGYGFKKINHDKYELRLDIRLRIAMKVEGDTLICHLIGNHEDIKRYLRDHRNK